MKIQHIRNACMIIHQGGNRILLDPCIGPKGSLPPYTMFRKRPRFNPLVGLPPGADRALREITCALITHCRYGHFDHLDRSAIRLLTDKRVPVYCTSFDAQYLMRRGINAVALKMNEKNEFLDGGITPVHATHGNCIHDILRIFYPYLLKNCSKRFTFYLL